VTALPIIRMVIRCCLTGNWLPFAARQSLPDDVELKSKDDFRYIGKHDRRLDARAKVTGEAVFGIDVERDGLVYAVVTRPPMQGAWLESVDDAQAREMPGVIDVLTIDRGVAVVAETYWQARKAQEKLDIRWDETDAVTKDYKAVFTQYRRAADDSSRDTERSEGDAMGRRLDATDNRFEAEYEAPFLAHATMEPQNATAEVTDTGMQVWAPTQGPDMARIAAARVSRFHLTRLPCIPPFLAVGLGADSPRNTLRKSPPSPTAWSARSS